MEFQEVQRFKQLWLWLLLGGLVLLFTYGIFQQLVLGEPWGSNPAPNLVLVLIYLFVLGIVVFMSSIQLKTTIDYDGIKAAFFPLTKQTILWDDVEEITIARYRPIRDYGGWGVRYSFKKGKALTISGDQGIKITTKKGQKILIGTNQPQEAKKVISEIFKEW